MNIVGEMRFLAEQQPTEKAPVRFLEHAAYFSLLARVLEHTSAARGAQQNCLANPGKFSGEQQMWFKRLLQVIGAARPTMTPEKPDVTPVAIVLYTRRGCHLCDIVHDQLTQCGIRPKVVDIDTDAELIRLHGDWVPVVEINGRVRFRGRVEPLLLRRLLDAARHDDDA